MGTSSRASEICPDPALSTKLPHADTESVCLMIVADIAAQESDFSRQLDSGCEFC